MRFISSDSTCFFHVLLLPLAVCLLYLNTLQSPFVLDDSQIFENNTEPIREFSWDSIKRLGSSRFHSERVLPNLSLTLNYNLNGTDVSGYHWFNIGVHAAVAVTVYFLAQLIFSLCLRDTEFRFKSELAFLAALLWAVHPLQTNAVTYIIQRMTSMAALFYLLSVLCYLKARLQDSFFKGRHLYGLAIVFGIMALFSKENTAVLPITLLGCEFFIIQAQHSTSNIFSRKNMVLAGVFLSGFLIIGIALLGSDPLQRVMEGYQYRDFTLLQRLLTEPRVIFYYLTLLILPLPSRMNIAYDYPLSTGIISPPQTLFALVGLAGAVITIVYLFRRDRLAAFALFWFLLNLSIESSFIPLMIIFEHRMYLPCMMLICAGVVWCYQVAGTKIHLARWGLVILAVVLAFLSWQRNQVWRSEISLWSDVVAKSPGLAWGQANLGKAYAEKGDYRQAEQYLRKAIALDPESGLAYMNLGVMYEKQDRLYEANMVLNKALKAKSTDPAKLYSNLAIVNLKIGNMNDAIQYASQAIQLKPYRYKSHEILGRAYMKNGDYSQAERVFLQAAEMFPQRGKPYISLASVYEKQNRLPSAMEILQRAFAFEDIHPAEAYNQLGILLWRMKRLPESIEAAHKALELDSDFLDAYLTLGISYEDSGKMDMAFIQFARGWKKGLNMVNIYNNWAEHHLNNNNPDRAIMYLKQAAKLEPGRAETHNKLSRAYSAKGMAAEAEYEMMRSLQPGTGQN